MYILSSTSITNALVARKNAGLDVKVVLNQTFPANQGNNQTAYDTLQAAGVGVQWGQAGFTFTHEKCLIIDGNTAWIMTMNAAATSAQNREFLAIDTLPEDVAEAEAVFQADFNGTTPSVTGTLLVAPLNARPQIVALINGALSTLDIEAETLSDYQVVGALGSAGDRGVVVHIVLSDDPLNTSEQDAVNQLKMHPNVSIVQVSTPYIHAKSIVADGTTAYVGSENFTTNSLVHNRELGVIFSTASEVQKVLTTTRTDFSHGTAL
jgi:phosphatidylserine/phosphatidylglycerophosphate/cardiolipin synthase-like enzyme